MSDLHAYHIGWWTHKWWPRRIMLHCLFSGRTPQGRAASRAKYAGSIWRDFTHHFPYRLRNIGGFPSRNKLHRPWQCEAEGVRFARRAFTAEGARRKMQRDLDNARGLITGYPIDSPWQLRRTARANAARIRQVRRGVTRVPGRD